MGQGPAPSQIKSRTPRALMTSHGNTTEQKIQHERNEQGELFELRTQGTPVHITWERVR